MTHISRRGSKRTHERKESRRKLPKGLLALAFFACLSLAAYQATNAVVTSAAYGDRELPIYCVDTTENKVALSFDAAWGAGRVMERMLFIFGCFRGACVI